MRLLTASLLFSLAHEACFGSIIPAMSKGDLVYCIVKRADGNCFALGWCSLETQTGSIWTARPSASFCTSINNGTCSSSHWSAQCSELVDISTQVVRMPRAALSTDCLLPSAAGGCPGASALAAAWWVPLETVPKAPYTAVSYTSMLTRNGTEPPTASSSLTLPWLPRPAKRGLSLQDLRRHRDGVLALFELAQIPGLSVVSSPSILQQPQAGDASPFNWDCMLRASRCFAPPCAFAGSDCLLLQRALQLAAPSSLSPFPVQVAVVQNSTANGSFIVNLWKVVAKAALMPYEVLVVDSVQAAAAFVRNDSCSQTSGRFALAYVADDASRERTLSSFDLFPSDDVLVVRKREPLDYLMFAEQLFTWHVLAFVGALCALLVLCSLGVMLAERLSGSDSEYALADGCFAILDQWFKSAPENRQPYSVPARFVIGVARFLGTCAVAVGLAIVLHAVGNVRAASIVSDPALLVSRVGVVSRTKEPSLPIGLSSVTVCADVAQCLGMLGAQQLGSAIVPMSQLHGLSSEFRVVGPFKHQGQSAAPTYRVLAAAAAEPWGSAAFARLADGLELARKSTDWDRLMAETFGGSEHAVDGDGQPSGFWEAHAVSVGVSIAGGVALLIMLGACCWPHCYAQFENCKAASLQYMTNTVELCDWRTKAQLKQLASRLAHATDVAEVQHVQAALQGLKLRMQKVQSESHQWWQGEDGSWYEGANPTPWHQSKTGRWVKGRMIKTNLR